MIFERQDPAFHDDPYFFHFIPLQLHGLACGKELRGRFGLGAYDIEIDIVYVLKKYGISYDLQIQHNVSPVISSVG